MKWIDMLVGTLLVGTFAAAQDGSAIEHPNGQPELRTVIGCLSKTGKSYVITGGGPGPKEFRIIAGDTSMLRGKVGQTVSVVGFVRESSPVDSSAPPYYEGSTTGVTYNVIDAREISVKGGLCSNPGEEYPGVHK